MSELKCERSKNLLIYYHDLGFFGGVASGQSHSDHQIDSMIHNQTNQFHNMINNQTNESNNMIDNQINDGRFEDNFNFTALNAMQEKADVDKLQEILNGQKKVNLLCRELITSYFCLKGKFRFNLVLRNRLAKVQRPGGWCTEGGSVQ